MILAGLAAMRMSFRNGRGGERREYQRYGAHDGLIGASQAAAEASTISGSLRTGKLTELATKQPACAFS